MIEIAFIAHVITSFYMVGLCWFVQIVHYPLFREVSLADFPKYQRKNFITGFVTVPVMTVEFTTGIYLLYENPIPLYFANMALLGIIAISTASLQIPIHLKLSHTATNELIEKLIRTNWIRTIGWTLRAAILGILLSQSLVFPI